MNTTDRIVDFESPPIAEVVLGVQFEKLQQLSSVFQGLFWSRVRDRYPNAQDVPPLAPVIEVAEETGPQPIEFTIGDFVAPRVFMTDASGRQLIQLQGDRFHHNWRRTQEPDAYPHYADIRSSFLDGWKEFGTFCQAEALGRPAVRQYELTYINHIVEGNGWSDAEGMTALFPWFAPTNANVEGVDMALRDSSFVFRSAVRECQGRLHVAARMGQRVQDKKKVVVFELTVRGAPKVLGDDTDMAAWSDQARAVIVKTFAHLTGDSARKTWGQTK